MAEEQKNPEITIHEEAGPKKTSWPEVFRLTADEAVKKIKEDMPTAHTVVLPYGRPVTCDYRNYRVRIFVNSTGKVASIPHIG
ncbi:subtilisin inhibitor CLSI-I-like [Impatiens glandulifera]|uniref:subtilisin inhibitor CLSI-I-like n=1 Tax=Impatiens glandulifera TaxID=253017 RepID=UPI001FB05A90|nr:subtilisin inhibitor CLSI-I-like [Impatiens glandulifera]